MYSCNKFELLPWGGEGAGGEVGAGGGGENGGGKMETTVFEQQ